MSHQDGVAPGGGQRHFGFENDVCTGGLGQVGENLGVSAMRIVPRVDFLRTGIYTAGVIERALKLVYEISSRHKLNELGDCVIKERIDCL